MTLDAILDQQIPAVAQNPMYVYVLTDCNGAMYIGITCNIQRRLAEHTSGEVKFTKKNYAYRSLVVRHLWIAPVYSHASRLERYLHCLDKVEVLELIAETPLWSKRLTTLARNVSLRAYEIAADQGFFGDIAKAPLSLPCKNQLTANVMAKC